MTDRDRPEAALAADLATLGERIADERFATELYRALAGGRVTKEGAAVALTWTRAETLVNQLREEEDEPPLALDGSGGEGELSRDAACVFNVRGWRWRGRAAPAPVGAG